MLIIDLLHSYTGLSKKCW